MARRRLLGLSLLVGSPFLRRIAFHGRRIAGQLDRRFFLALLEGVAVFVKATLLAISRGGQTWVNPPAEFVLQPMDDALVVAESLGTLEPLRPTRAMVTPAAT